MKQPQLNFDIDKYLNPYIPQSRIHRLPTPLARFLGHRSNPQHESSNAVGWFWALVGGFCGIALIEGVFKASPEIQRHAPPVIIGSFGAGAILEYNAIESPFAQPRNLMVGQFLSAIVGVGLQKLFALSTSGEDLRWLGGALAVGISSAIMGFTKTVHPPAGATALLAVTSPDIAQLGWYLLPLVLLGCTLMLVSALLINNIQRRFPVYWWTPIDLSNKKHRMADTDIEKVSQVEKEEEESEVTDEGRSEDTETHDLQKLKTRETLHEEREQEIKITARRIVVPDWLVLNDWEKSVIEIIKERLVEGLDGHGRAGRSQSRKSDRSLSRRGQRVLSEPSTRRPDRGRETEKR